MQGLNVNVEVYRMVQAADDVAGGVQRDSYSLIDTCRVRISQRIATLQMRAQGLGSDLFYDAVLSPATRDVQTNDVLVPTDGSYDGVEFLITSVIRPSMRLDSARAHLKLQLERWDEGKVLENIA